MQTKDVPYDIYTLESSDTQNLCMLCRNNQATINAFLRKHLTTKKGERITVRILVCEECAIMPGLSLHSNT